MSGYMKDNFKNKISIIEVHRIREHSIYYSFKRKKGMDSLDNNLIGHMQMHKLIFKRNRTRGTHT